MDLKYRIEAEYRQPRDGPIRRLPAIQEKGLGSILYSGKHRHFLRSQADGLIHENPRRKVVVYPDRTAEVLDKETGELIFLRKMPQFVPRSERRELTKEGYY
ncbi:MAG: hypothetical protein DDT42_01625 [candidate division WS2 bacterium]|uniref:Uncharacterized protein n=1 Tax=Psychracetigena formicireducens TaxID=2986056 RepID=A0A9E2BHN0_PSYF1|nr:hypothetical protein [Candidatus Psychracetigena formicireducens]